MAWTYEELQRMSIEDLVDAYNKRYGGEIESREFILNEISNRKEYEQNKKMLEMTDDVVDLTDTVKNLTWFILGLTVLNLIFVAINVLSKV